MRARAAGIAVLAAAISTSCDCQAPVDGLLVSDTLPAVEPSGFSEHAYRLVVPRDGSVMVRFLRRDQRADYRGPVYLFVTGPTCARVSGEPSRMRNGATFRPDCPVLASSIGLEGNCCLGDAQLAAPAHVRAGQEVKVFVYGISTPAALPFDLTYRIGDNDCWF